MPIAPVSSSSGKTGRFNRPAALGAVLISSIVLSLSLSLYVVTQYRPLINRGLVRVTFVYQYLTDENLRACLKVLAEESAREEREVFETIWDTDAGVWLSKKLFRPVTMYGQQKYMYRPNLKIVTFLVNSGLQSPYFEMEDTPELRSRLATLNPTSYTILDTSSFDRFGFRKTDFDVDQGCHKTVLFVGDSFTEGLGVRDHETFVNHFGHLVNQQAKARVCPINAGVDGYGMLEEVFIVEQYFGELGYHVVFLMHFPNDIHVDFLKVIRASRDLTEEWKRHDIYLRNLVDFCRAHEIALVVVAIPPRQQLKAPDTKRNYQEKLKAFCDAERVLFVDLFDEVKQEGEKKIYLKDDAHFSVYGHEVVARVLWERTKHLFVPGQEEAR